MLTPTLVSLAADTGTTKLLGVDDQGNVWRGEITRYKAGKEYIE